MFNTSDPSFGTIKSTKNIDKSTVLIEYYKKAQILLFIMVYWKPGSLQFSCFDHRPVSFHQFFINRLKVIN